MTKHVETRHAARAIEYREGLGFINSNQTKN
jgi:hypothetical protein